MQQFDFLVIGGGSAGFNAARTARSLGLTTAIIDGASRLGGLCILRGCMPSKTLFHMTEVLHLARHGADFGLRIPKAEPDVRAMQARKRRIIDEFARYREEQLAKQTVLRSGARFLDSHTLELDDGTHVRGKHILIATGSRVSVPPVPGLAETPFWTSDEVLDLDHAPKSVIVLGGGIVACELAQYLARIGTRVIQIQRSPQILRDFSPEASGVVASVFRREGIELYTGTSLRQVRATRGGVAVQFEHDGKLREVRAAHLFNALGREPNVADLNLEAAGVKTNEAGQITINAWQQTSRRHIYAAGDVCGPFEIVHLAVAQGELAARHAAGLRGLRKLAYDQVVTVAFTSPPVAHLGVRESDLPAERIVSASYPFNDHGKSILMNALDGFVKVWADRATGRLLGAEIVGPDAGELIHCLSGPLALGATAADLLKAQWYHPTLAEILTYPLEDIEAARAED
ncbi:dihydrolipoyl dehydrogenase family protein [Nibricoccus sp. IMCC34717]|uniref:dihydrolipoyl dehydrogenase family protein n=1 Tax=Nibricoccus sp. IMCC34717 TaxID=3034021 RepID=UPI003850A861